MPDEILFEYEVKKQEKQKREQAEQAHREIVGYSLKLILLTAGLVIMASIASYLLLARYATDSSWLMLIIPFVALLLIFAMTCLIYKWIDAKCISKPIYHTAEVWRRQPIAMRPGNRVHGDIGGTFVLGIGGVNGSINTAVEYRYLYDSGDGIVWGTIPAKRAKIYPTLADDGAPYISYWRTDKIRRSLLTDPPTDLPLSDLYGEESVDYGYSIYVSEKHMPNMFELI